MLLCKASHCSSTRTTIKSVPKTVSKLRQRKSHKASDAFNASGNYMYLPRTVYLFLMIVITNSYHLPNSIFFMVKGPAADATDAPQP
jgi:hypothetical protein